MQSAEIKRFIQIHAALCRPFAFSHALCRPYSLDTYTVETTSGLAALSARSSFFSVKNEFLFRGLVKKRPRLQKKKREFRHPFCLLFFTLISFFHVPFLFEKANIIRFWGPQE